MDGWFGGSMDGWFGGSVVRWFGGSVVQWLGGSVRSSLLILLVITLNKEVEGWNKPPFDASRYILCPGASPSCVLCVSLWQSSPSYCT